MAFPVTGKFKVTQADAVLTIAFGKITFGTASGGAQRVRGWQVHNEGAPGDSDVIVSLNGTEDNFVIHPGDVAWSEPMIDAWYTDLYVRSSAAVLIPNYTVCSSEK